MVNGETFITCEEFNKNAACTGAPRDYTYAEYVEDSSITKDEWLQARMEFLGWRIV